MDAVRTFSGPTIFCFDGSEGSRAALAAAADHLKPGPVVVLTVWETIALRVARGGFSGGMTVANEGELDAQEEEAARAAATDGAARARARGWDAEARLAAVQTTVWRAIVDVGDELDASLIVCGTRGLSGIKSLVLGSVSHAVVQHAHRPVLIAPEPDVGG